MEDFQKFYDRTLRFLSFRPRSEKEILDFLARKKVDKSTTKKIIRKLKKLNFIDDKEFAKWWIEQRQGSKPRGKRVIKIELKQKGIPGSIIHNSEFIIQNQVELAKKSIVRRVDQYRKLPREKAYQKLTQFLARRGFDWDTIKEVIDEVLGK